MKPKKFLVRPNVISYEDSRYHVGGGTTATGFISGGAFTDDPAFDPWSTIDLTIREPGHARIEHKVYQVTIEEYVPPKTKAQLANEFLRSLNGSGATLTDKQWNLWHEWSAAKD